MSFSWGVFPKKCNVSSISADQSCKPIGTSQADLCYHLPCPNGGEETLTFSCRACHQVKKALAYLLQSSVFTQWIILNAGWVKNHRAISSPVIVTRGEGLKERMWVIPTYFFEDVCDCYPVTGMEFVFGVGAWSLLNMLIIHIKREPTLWLSASTTDSLIAWIQELYSWAMFSK